MWRNESKFMGNILFLSRGQMKLIRQGQLEKYKTKRPRRMVTPLERAA